MSKKNKIAVIGGGSWATALVKILCEQHARVQWYVRNTQDVQHIEQFHHNPNYLSDVEIDPDKVRASDDIRSVVQGVDVILLVIPAAFIEDALSPLKAKDFKDKIVISAVKGMIPKKHLLVTDLIQKDYKVDPSNIAIIAGPCHAEEVALERQSYLTIASTHLETAEHFADMLSCRYIKATPFGDLLGIEYSAVLKNVIALACGIAHGLGYGDNFQAVMVTNALSEIEAFLDAIYPYRRNLIDTAYLGDLLVTAYSQFSRNRTFGNMIGRGYSVKSAKVEMNMVAEGYYAAKSVYHINKKYEVDMPILNATYRILYDKASAKKEFKKLKKAFV